MKLTEMQSEALSTLFESDGYKVIKMMLENERVNMAKSALSVGTIEELKFVQGRADALKQFHLKLKSIHKAIAAKEPVTDL